MPIEIPAKALSDYCRNLALKRWRRATPEQRYRSAQHASVIRWQRVRAWKQDHAEEAAAARAIGKALRALAPKAEPTDDEGVERLERRLSRAQEVSEARMPWGAGFRRRARGKSL
jgi:hypothetical protein